MTAGHEIIGHVFLCAHAPSIVVGLSRQLTVFLGGCGVLFVLTLIFAVWLKQLLALKAVELEPLIPLVPPGAEPVPEPQEILPDEFRLLKQKGRLRSPNKVEKGSRSNWPNPPKEPKPRLGEESSAENPTAVLVQW